MEMHKMCFGFTLSVSADAAKNMRFYFRAIHLLSIAVLDTEQNS